MSIDQHIAQFGSYIPGSTIVWKAMFCLAATWVLLEIGFYLVILFVVLPRAQKLSKTHPYHGDMMKMMTRAVDLVKQLHCYTFEKYLSGFCLGADFKDIHLGNFRSFLAWAMFNKHLPDITEQELNDVCRVLEYAKQEHPELKSMPEGHNPEVKHCRMTLDPIPMIHRPLLMYVLIRLKEAITGTFFMPAYGFQNLEVGGQTYWFKKQCSNNSKENSPQKSSTAGSTGCEPMLFLHGISTGWGGYLDLACAMGAGRDIILVDVDAVKLNSLQFQMPTPQKLAESINHILERHHIDRVSLVGHSFGSMTAGWFLRQHPERVCHVTLIDPVSMLLNFPEVAYSFLYRNPSSLMEWIIHLFAAREITISHTLRRNFWWYNNDLWLEEVPDHIGVVVGIATHDEIINPVAVQEYVGNCRRARIEKRERLSAKASADDASDASSEGAATTSSEKSSVSSDNKVENILAVADSFSCLEGLENVPAKEVKEVAMIECLVWDNYSHGQILMSSPEHKALVATVRSNEKLGTRAL